ncbi:MAG TPA: O-antigen ligase family protein [Solirubrobacteraceae bacterium]|jgi:hypothetical protein
MQAPAPSRLSRARVTAAAAAGVAVAVVLALLVATAPPLGLALATAIGGGAWAHAHPDRLARPLATVRRLAAGALLALALVAGLAAIAAVAIAAALSPALCALLVIVAAILVLAWRAPVWALGAALLLVGFEGSVKLLIALERRPLGDYRSLGAAAIDVALFGAIAGVLYGDRLRTPRALWAQATDAERIVMALLGAWLALSVAQIPLGGLVRGIEGFRVFQAYTGVAVAVAIVAARHGSPRRVMRAALGLGLVVSLYAAFRVVFGVSWVERDFAVSVSSVTVYGGAVRAIGSFSSSIGMGSFLTPVAVAGLVGGYLMPRVRVLGWATAGLAIIAIIASYGRSPLFGILTGLLFALILLVGAGDVSTRRKVVAGLLVVATVGVTFGGLQLTSRGSDKLETRARGVLNPSQDESVQLRWDTWKEQLERVSRRPWGYGIGTVGSASADVRRQLVTTDNSYLKVLVEQGVEGLVVFLAGLLGAMALLTQRIARRTDEWRAVGVTALAAFAGFLGLCFTGEYVEQPGKAVAWALLGLAVAAAFRPPREVAA